MSVRTTSLHTERSSALIQVQFVRHFITDILHMRDTTEWMMCRFVEYKNEESEVSNNNDI
jgi:hypothetical protein